MSYTTMMESAVEYEMNPDKYEDFRIAREQFLANLKNAQGALNLYREQKNKYHQDPTKYDYNPEADNAFMSREWTQEELNSEAFQESLIGALPRTKYEPSRYISPVYAADKYKHYAGGEYLTPTLVGRDTVYSLNEKSYPALRSQFARDFNADPDVREGIILYHMKQLNPEKEFTREDIMEATRRYASDENAVNQALDVYARDVHEVLKGYAPKSVGRTEPAPRDPEKPDNTNVPMVNMLEQQPSKGGGR